MESEARLAMVDGGLPMPKLQYEILDGNGELRRVDFAWPDAKVAVEYDGVDWHSGADAMRRDRRRQAALLDVGWVVICIVFEDVQIPGVGLRQPHRAATSSYSRGVSVREMCARHQRVARQTRTLAQEETSRRGRGRRCGPGGSECPARIRLAHRRFRPHRPSHRGNGRTAGRPPTRRSHTATPARDPSWCPTITAPPGSESSCGIPSSAPSQRSRAFSSSLVMS